MKESEAQGTIDAILLMLFLAVIVVFFSAPSLCGCAALRGQSKYDGPVGLWPEIGQIRHEGAQLAVDVWNPTTKVRFKVQPKCDYAGYDVVTLAPRTMQTYLLDEHESNCKLAYEVLP